MDNQELLFHIRRFSHSIETLDRRMKELESKMNDLELIPFGWAPGNYAIICKKCNKPYWDGSDENSISCRPCAVAAFEEMQQKLPPEHGPTPRFTSIPPSETLPKETPITVEELLRRGMSERLAEIINGGIGDYYRTSEINITNDELGALGYGPPCPCGERGLIAGETVCEKCGNCKECCEGGCEGCENCSCKA